MRLILLFTALAVVLGLAVMASQTPAPRPISTPAEVFSAARAMADVREIARAPIRWGPTTTRGSRPI